jgi:hypothetical protein
MVLPPPAFEQQKHQVFPEFSRRLLQPRNSNLAIQ